MNFIIIILMALIPFNTFSGENSDYDNIAKMGINFYNDIYDNIDNTKKSTFRLSLETGLSQDVLNDFVNNKDSSKSFKEIMSYCNKNFGEEQFGSCKEMILNKINNEKLIFDLEKSLQNETYGNEIFADGDLSNSFFDIVNDLNIIDIILFGEDATIFFFKYDKENNNIDNPYKPSIDSLGNLQDENRSINNNDSLDGQNNNTDKGINEGTSLNSDDLLNAYWTNTNVNTIIDKGNICKDPLKLAFSGDGNKDIFSNNSNSIIDSSGEDIGIIKNYGISSELFNEITGGINDSKKNESTNFTTNLNISDKNKRKLDKNCNKELYGGFICLDNLKKNWWCTKDETFCIEINYKISNHKLLGKGEDTSCIFCIVKSIIKVIDKELVGRSLQPRENSNKNGNIPNWLGIFRPPSKLISVQWLPLPWLNSKNEEGITKESMKEDREYSNFFTRNSTDCESRCMVKPNGGDDTLDTTYCLRNCKSFLDANYDSLVKFESKESNIESKKGYFSDVNGRFSEFRELFENGVENQIKAFPFMEFENIKKCEQIR